MKYAVLGLLFLAVGVSACATILGLEEAECDPRDPGCPGFESDAPTDTDEPTDNMETASSDPEVTESDAPDAASTDPSETNAGETDVQTDTDVGSDADAGAANQAGTDDPDASFEPTAPVPDAGVEPDPAVAKQSLCTEYCERTQDNCVDDSLQHNTVESCIAICLSMMVSEAEQVDPDSTDTIECRLAAARDAEIAEPEFNCEAAGMTGGNVCGAQCPVFCDMMARVCPAEFAATFTNCTEECPDLPRETEPFSLNMTSGNTLECRFNHLRLATDSERPDIHCPHVAGLAQCVD